MSLVFPFDGNCRQFLKSTKSLGAISALINQDCTPSLHVIVFFWARTEHRLKGLWIKCPGGGPAKFAMSAPKIADAARGQATAAMTRRITPFSVGKATDPR